MPVLSDGLPVFTESDCGVFTVSRAMTPRGVLYDAWQRRPGQMALQLAGGLASGEEAVGIVMVAAIPSP